MRHTQAEQTGIVDENNVLKQNKFCLTRIQLICFLDESFLDFLEKDPVHPD